MLNRPRGCQQLALRSHNRKAAPVLIRKTRVIHEAADGATHSRPQTEWQSSLMYLFLRHMKRTACQTQLMAVYYSSYKQQQLCELFDWKQTGEVQTLYVVNDSYFYHPCTAEQNNTKWLGSPYPLHRSSNTSVALAWVFLVTHASQRPSRC